MIPYLLWQGSSRAAPTQQAVVLQGAAGDWKDFVLERSQRQARRELRTQERQLKKVEKKIANAYKRLAVEKNADGILMNLHRLETKQTQIVARIQELKIDFNPPEFDDDEDIEVLLLS